jgi:signal transduction histidine kinase
MVRSRSQTIGFVWPLIAGLAILVALYAASVSGYLLFHSVAEIFAIVISGAVFTLAWNSRRFSNQYYLLFVGIALLAASAINILHVLSYDGLGIFSNQGGNLPTQLWLARRYLESIALLVAPLFLLRRFNPYLMLVALGAVTAALIWSIFAGLFPVAYIDGVGLTPFKVVSEYIIAALFLAAAAWLYRERKRLDPGAASLLIWALVISAAAEILFTLYSGVYDAPNRLGHFLTFIAYYLIYRAIVESGVIKPYTLLSEANVSLSEREAELTETAARLQAEVTARQEAEAVAVRQSHEMQALARALVQVQEAQSRALSREIHDSSAQGLSALKMGLALLKRKAAGTDGLVPAIDELRQEVDAIAEDLHRLAVNLRPSSLDRYGLEPALEQLIDSVSKQAGIRISLESRGIEERLPDEVETAFYRIVQEATTNIRRYAKATRASVSIERTASGVTLTVKDDGCGFDVDEALSRGRLGLLGMRERAQMLGGTFAISSSPGRGTVICVDAPVDAPSD